MIKEALQYLISLGAANQHTINGQSFSDKPLHLAQVPRPEFIEIRNLSGLVEYVQTNYDNQPPVLIHVSSPTQVSVMSTFNADMARNTLIVAEALLPNVPFGRFSDVESFNILLQSCFVENPDRNALLSVVGNIAEENTMTTHDDGVSQTITAKSGIAQLAQVPIPNPVRLKPYRSFVEIEQPESAFVFRMQKGGGESAPMAALFEADGGEWRLHAIEKIKDYLNLSLAEEVENKTATIIA